MARRYFTLDEANRALKEIEPAMQRVLQIHALIRSKADALSARGLEITASLLSGEDELALATPIDGALVEAQALYGALLEEVDAITTLGAEVKGLEDGLVDFWSLLDGQKEVLLCWKMGEREIAFYHSPEAGFAGRISVQGRRFLVEKPSAAPRTVDS